MDERQWLSHPETGGTFHCPATAVDDWTDMGWQPCEAPEEPNPVIAEHLAWRAEQAAANARENESTGQDETTPIKPAARLAKSQGEVSRG